MKQTVNLDFCDFARNFRKTEYFLYRLLSERFEVRLCDQPDFLIYSDFGHAHRLHNGVKIFLTGESTYPDFSECDYALTTHYLEDPRHLRLPFYVQDGQPEWIVKPPGEAERVLATKTKFCAFVVSNYSWRRNRNRVQLFQKLSRYKPVDSAGRVLNNIGGPIPGGTAGKLDFLRAYKFNIAFENTALPGYTTEKLFHAMVARCLPIYWGNPRIGEEFNPRSFLNRRDFPSDEALIEKIIELDRDDAKYLESARQPYFHQNQPNEFFSHRRLLDFFERIFTAPITPVSERRRRRRTFSFGRWVWVKRYHLDRR